MARKSRKAAIQAMLSGQPLPAAESAAPQQTVWNAGGYVRLSVLETRDRKDSHALSNQKELLRHYIGEQSDLKLCGLYADNGETGTNFERPEFQRLMKDIYAGKINCIVVKDLSRFGRNAAEAGNYLERVFPFLGVRFIAMTDGYDSIAPNASDMLPIALRNFLNEAYSMDISRKSGSVLREKQKRGSSLGPTPPMDTSAIRTTSTRSSLTRKPPQSSGKSFSALRLARPSAPSCAGSTLRASCPPAPTATGRVSA